MKKIVSFLLALTFLVCLTSAEAATPGSSTDPLISKTYMDGTYKSGVLSQVKQTSSDTLTAVYSAAAESASAYNNLQNLKARTGEMGGYVLSSGFESVTFLTGGSTRIAAGGSMILLSGNMTVSCSGAVLNLASGTTVSSGSSLSKNVRYFCAENTIATYTAASNCVCLVDGYHSGYSNGYLTGSSGGASIIVHPQDVTVAPGESASFEVGTSGSGLSYQWQYSWDNGATWGNMGSAVPKTATLQLTTQASYDGIMYRCAVTDSTGTTVYSNGAKLNVTTLKIMKGPASQTVMPGEKATFSVVATGSGLSYQWQYSWDNGETWGNMGSAVPKTATLQLTTQASYDGIMYRCAVTDSTGTTVYSNGAKLSVKSVVITQQPRSQMVSPGEKATFSVVATGSGLSYQWQYSWDNGANWGNMGSAVPKTATLQLTTQASYDGIMYRCAVTDSAGTTVYSNGAKLNIDVVKITQQPESQTVAPGEKATFSVVATGSGLSYQWQYSWDNGATWGNMGSAVPKTATLQVTTQASYDGIMYRCAVTDSTGTTVYSNGAKLNIDVVKITQQPESQTVAPGEKATFSVTATGSGLSYQWQYSWDNGATWGNMGSAVPKTATLQVTTQASYDGIMYRCAVTDSTGMTVYSDGAKLNIDVVKITQQPESQTVAPGEKATFSVVATGSGLSYQWQYSWDNGATWGNMGSAVPKTATLQLTTQASYDGIMYRCAVTDSTGTTVYSDGAKLNIDFVKITQQPESQTVAPGEKATFSVVATGSGLSYQWQYSWDNGATWGNMGSAVPKTATLQLTTQASYDGIMYRCAVTDSTGMTVYSNGAKLNIDVVKITQQPEPQTVAPGEKATFSVVATGSGLSYQWQYSWDNGATWGNMGSAVPKTATLQLTTQTSYDGIMYRCAVTDSTGMTIYSNGVKLNINN